MRSFVVFSIGAISIALSITGSLVAGDTEGVIQSSRNQVELSVVVKENELRHDHQSRPGTPRPQRPEKSNVSNIDTGKPIHEWQHATDDWFGLRPQLDDMGIVIEATLTADYSKVFHGGANEKGDAFRHLFDFNITLDTKRLIGFEGGTLFIDFMNINGQDGSEEVGDIQAFSNIDSSGRTQIAELWYEQFLLDDKLRIKLGKVEANSEFAFVEHGGEFINSSMGFSPTIFTLPTYPDPAMSVIVFVYPAEWFYLGVGVFDGALQEGIPTGSRGPSTFFGDPSDLFVIGEAGVTWTLDTTHLSGRFAGGGWGHTGTFDCFDGSTEKGTAGFYLLLDQTVWREILQAEDDEQGIGLFLQYGWADDQVSEVEHHIGGGFAWTGALPTRDDDVWGVGITHVQLTDQSGAGFVDRSETAFELFYKVQITPWVSIKPDLQYIINPGGAGLDDALVGTLRVEISF